MQKPVFLNILFRAITKSAYDFVKYRHSLDSRAFVVLEKEYELSYFKSHEPNYMPNNYTKDEFFFPARNKFFFLPIRMSRRISKKDPDVVFVHGFGFPIQVLCMRFFLSHKTKIIVQHHAEKPFRNSIKRWFQKRAYRNADAFLFASKGLADSFIQEEIIKDKNKVHEVMEVSCAFKKEDKRTARQKLNIPHKNVFLWVGRLDKNKDPLCVLEALSHYKALDPNFGFYMIYGTNEMETELKSFINSNNLNENVKLIGQIPHEKLEDWFNASDYFISASHYEGSGIALCEAMACGCVPIATNIDSFASMTDAGDCGYLFEPGNSQQLFNILQNLKEQDLDGISKKAQLKFEKDLSYEAIGRNILTVARSLK